MHIFTVWAEGSREDGAGGETVLELSSATSGMFVLTEIPCE